MKKHLILFAAAALTLASSCGREIAEPAVVAPEEPDGVEVTFHAVADPGTKTQLDGKHVLWSAQDNISVFYNSKNNKFTSTNTEPSATVDFSGELAYAHSVDGSGSTVYAVSPYNVRHSCSGDIVTICIPTYTNAVAGSFDPKAFPSVAVTTTDELRFYNVCGGIKLRFSKSDVTSLSIYSNNGEPLSGFVNVGFNSDGTPYIVSVDGTDEIDVNPDGYFFRTDCDYYIPVIPGEFSDGLSFYVYTADKPYSDGIKEYHGSKTFKRNVFASASGFDKNLSYYTTISWYPQPVDLGLSVLWGATNLGGEEPEDLGYYYSWGETEPKDVYDEDHYSYPSEFVDPVALKLNSKWHTPSYAEVDELINNCEWEWTNQGGVDGYLVTSKVPGFTGNSIFLPAAGSMLGSVIYYAGRLSYWTSTRVGTTSPYVLGESTSHVPGIYTANRYLGKPIRPVKEKMTLKHFAQEFVKGLEVWESTVGAVESDDNHLIANGTAWENAHYIPIEKTGGPYDYNDGNQFDYRLHYRWTFNIDGHLYYPDEAWEIALRGLLEMCTAEGQEFYSTITGPGDTATPADGARLDRIPIPTLSKPLRYWGENPWDELLPDGSYGLKKSDGTPVTQVDLQFMLNTLPWSLKKSYDLKEVCDYVSFGGTDPEDIIYNGYKGKVSSMRQLLVMMRIYKYLLDNNINENVYTAIKNLNFDFDLYGPGVANIDGDDSDWGRFPSSKVAVATCPSGASYKALKLLKAYADPSYIYLYFEWDTDLVSLDDVSYVPLDIYINGDNDTSTGFAPWFYSESGIDVMYEGFLSDGTNVSLYNPGAFIWAGGADHTVWNWTEVDMPSQGFALGSGTNGKYEVRIDRSRYPGTLSDTFTLGVLIYQNWNTAGVLPTGDGASPIYMLQIVTDK